YSLYKSELFPAFQILEVDFQDATCYQAAADQKQRNVEIVAYQAASVAAVSAEGSIDRKLQPTVHRLQTLDLDHGFYAFPFLT
ncbi:MAG TPA: hypothetical protein VLZ81_07320, partial [Blastocatellia bacterium]|nr:hypothetical protein [Blastocatellia bacterium]